MTTSSDESRLNIVDENSDDRKRTVGNSPTLSIDENFFLAREVLDWQFPLILLAFGFL